MAARWDGVAQWFARLAGSLAARVVDLRRGISPDTPLGSPGDSVLLAETGRKTGWPGYVVGCRSGAGAKIGRRARLIHEKVIGHDLAVFAPGIGRRTAVAVRCGRYGRLALLAGRGAFALLHQPTRQHGRGVLFEPGIEQLRDLLAEIGSMAQTRKFVTLQRITGRRQKKLPGRLGFVIQENLQETKLIDITSIVNVVKSAQIRTYCGKVCKSVVFGSKQMSFARRGAAS